MSEQKILVPVYVEALLVDPATSEAEVWKDLSVNYSMIAARLGRNLEDGNLKELSSGLCEPGVHLHWALPAALTHGLNDENGITFPNVPDRWLIVRTNLDGDLLVQKKWILESSYKGNDGTSKWVEKSGTVFSPTQIGRSFLLDEQYAGDPIANDPLTAIAPGNPSFAAVYAACRDVFGFYDDMKGARAGVYSYSVFGWYSNSGHDPIRKLDDKADAMQQQIRASILSRWHIPSLEGAGDSPSGIVCHGHIHSVVYDNTPGKRYTYEGQRKAVNIAIGNTAPEAKSMQLGAVSGLDTFVMNAFLEDAVKDLNNTLKIEELLDGKSFSGIDGGTLWEIQPIKDDKEEQRKQPDLFILFSDTTFADAYALLRRQQEKYDWLLSQLRHAIAELGAAYEKEIIASVGGNADIKAKTTLNQNYLKGNIKAIIDEIGQAKAVVDEQIAYLCSHPLLLDTKEPDKKNVAFELAKKQGPRFWKPSEPAIVLSGPGLPTQEKYSNDGTKTVICRITDEVSTAIAIKDANNKKKDLLLGDGFQLSIAVKGTIDKSLEDSMKKLYLEKLYFDPMMSGVLSRLYYNTAVTNERTEALSRAMKDLVSFQSSDTETESVITEIVSDSRRQAVGHSADILRFAGNTGIQQWRHPFTPIYMVWYADFFPSYTIDDTTQKYDDSAWRFDGRSYRFKGSVSEQNKFSYSGKAIVTDAIAGLLKQKLPPSYFHRQNLSQTLNGFSDYLLMRYNGIRLPLLKTEKRIVMSDERLQSFLDETRVPAGMAAGANWFSPYLTVTTQAPYSFFPVRAGHIRLPYLSLVDAFGQVHVLKNDDEDITWNTLQIAPKMRSGADEELIELKPVIVQHSRIDLRWYDAGTTDWRESNSDPQTSPVCGWMLPDKLSSALHIYEADGRHCGSLAIVKDSQQPTGKKLVWKPSPGTGSQSFATSITNSYLKDFVSSFYNDTKEEPVNRVGELEILLDCCHRKYQLLHGSQSTAPSVSQLIGQPLAVVRAGIKMELQGMPAQPQGWNHLLNDKKIIDPPGLEHTGFPVYIGDFSDNQDGLVAYFEGGENSGMMHLPLAAPVYGFTSPFFKQDPVGLSFGGQNNIRELILLIDPSASVKATCGVLPAKSVSLPTYFYARGMEQIEVTLEVAPFLGITDELAIPVCTEQEKVWKFITKNSRGEWEQPIDIADPGKKSPALVSVLSAI